MNSKTKKILLRTLGVLLPSAAVGGIVSATVDTETEEANDPNTIVEVNEEKEEMFSLLGETRNSIQRITSTDKVSEDRTRTEYDFDSGLNTQLIVDQAETLKQTNSAPFSQTTSVATKNEEARALQTFNRLIEAGVDLNTLVSVLVAFRADYEDTFNVDTDSWASVIGQRYPLPFREALNTAKTVNRMLRIIKGALKSTQVLAQIPIKFDAGKAIFDYAFETVRKYPVAKPNLLEFKKRVGGTYEASFQKVYTQWKNLDGKVTTGFDVNRFSPIDTSEVLKQIGERVKTEASVQPKLKANFDTFSDVVDGDSLSLESLPIEQEWFNKTEREAYEYVKKHKPYETNPGIYLDPSKRPDSIADYIRKNDIIERVTNKDKKVFDELLDFINKSMSDVNVRRLGTLQNTGIMTTDVAKRSELVHEYNQKIKHVQASQNLNEAEKLEQVKKIREQRQTAITEFNKGLSKNNIQKSSLSIEDIRNQLNAAKKKLERSIKLTSFDDAATGAVGKKKTTLVDAKKSFASFEKKLAKLKTEQGVKQAESASDVVQSRGQKAKAKYDALISRLETQATTPEKVIELNQIKKRWSDTNKRLNLDASGLDTAKLKTNTLHNRLDTKDFDRLNETLNRASLAEGKRTSFRSPFRTSIDEVRQNSNQVRAFQDLYERAMRRDAIFADYHELKKAISLNTDDIDDILGLLRDLTRAEGLTKSGNPKTGFASTNIITNEGTHRYHYDYVDGKKVNNATNADYVKQILNESEEATNARKFDNAVKVDAKSLRKIGENTDTAIRRSIASAEMVPEALKAYQDQSLTLLNELEFLSDKYREAADQIILDYPSPSQKNLALNQLDDLFLSKVKNDPEIAKLFDAFYGGTPVNDMVNFEEFLVGKDAVVKNVALEANTFNEAGQTLADFYNKNISDAHAKAVKSQDLLNQILNDEAALAWSDFDNQIIDVKNSDPRLLEYVQNAYDDAIDLDRQLGRFNTAFDEGMLKPIENLLPIDELNLSNNKITEIRTQFTEATTAILDDRRALKEVGEEISAKNSIETVLKNEQFSDPSGLKKWSDYHIAQLETDIDRLRKQASNVNPVLEQKKLDVQKLLDDYDVLKRDPKLANKKFIYVPEDSALRQSLNDIINKRDKATRTLDQLEEAKVKNSGFYYPDTLRELRNDINIDIEHFKTYDVGGEDLFDRAVDEMRLMKSDLSNSIDEAAKYANKVLNGDELTEANKAFARLSKNWDEFKDAIEGMDDQLDQYNDYVKSLREKSLVNGKASLYKTSFAEEVKNIDFPDLNKSGVRNEKINVETPSEIRSRNISDTVDGVIDNTPKIPDMENILNDLNKLTSQLDTSEQSVKDIVKWGRQNLSELQKARSLEVIKFNKELLSANPDNALLAKLANNIASMDEQVIERTVTLMRTSGEDAAEIERVVKRQKELLENAALESTFDNIETSDLKTGEAVADSDTVDTSKRLSPFFDTDSVDEVDGISKSFEEYRKAKAENAKNPKIAVSEKSIANIGDLGIDSKELTTLDKLSKKAEEVRDVIDEYKQALLKTDDTVESSSKISEIRKRLQAQLEIYQESVGQAAAGTLGTFDDTKTYANSEWYTQRGNAIDQTVSNSDSFSELQKRYATLESLSDDFQQTINKADDLTVKLFTVDEAKEVFNHVKNKKIANKVEVGVTTAKKTVAATKTVVKSVKKLSKAKKAYAIAMRFSGKFADYLDPAGLLIEYTIKSTVKLGGIIASVIKKAASKAATLIAKQATDAKHGYGVADTSIDSIQAVIKAKTQIKTWKEAAEQTSKQITKLQKQISEGADTTGDLQKALTSQKKFLDGLNSKIDDAAKLADDAVDVFKKTVTSNIDTTISSLKKQLQTLETLAEGIDQTAEARAITTKLKALQDFKDANVGLDAAEQLKKLKNTKGLKSIAKTVQKAALKQSSAAVDKALESVDKAEDALKVAKKAYDKTRSAVKAAKKAGKITDTLADSLSVLQKSVRFADKASDAARSALLVARLSHASNLKYLKYIKKAVSYTKYALKVVGKVIQASKIAKIVVKAVSAALKVVRVASKFVAMIPFLGEIVEVAMMGVSIWMAIEKNKATRKIQDWNKEAWEWRKDIELNPWAVPTNSEYKKYHAWAVGALPAVQNYGYADDLKFAETVSDPSNHPYFSCHGGEGVPTKEFSYPLISKDYKKDYDNVYSQGAYNDIYPESGLDYLDVIDPIAVTGNLVGTGSIVGDEVKDELWTDSTAYPFYINHVVVSPTQATKTEKAYTYPVVNKDCYFFVGKYAPKNEKDDDVSYSDRQGLYHISKKRREQLIADGADAETLDKLMYKQEDTFTYKKLSGINFKDLKDASNTFKENNEEGFIVKTKKYEEQKVGKLDTSLLIENDRFYRNVYTLVENYDPTKTTLGDLSSYDQSQGYFSEGVKEYRIKDLTEDELFEMVEDSATTEKSKEYKNVTYTSYIGGEIVKNTASQSYNQMEEGGTNPSVYRTFRYVYTNSGQEYINKKTEEILAYNGEQIGRTLLDIKRVIVSRLSTDNDFVTKLSKDLSGGTNEKLTPLGVRNLLNQLEESKLVSMLTDFDWDLHIDDFSYWQVKDGDSKSFKNKTMLDDRDKQAHPWLKLISQNRDFVLNKLKGILYSSARDTRRINMIDVFNRGVGIEMSSSLQIVSAVSEKINQKDVSEVSKPVDRYVVSIFGEDALDTNSGEDPLGIVESTRLYTIDRLVTLFGSSTNSEKFTKAMKIIFTERFRYLLLDVKPESSILNKLIDATTIQEIDEIIATYIDDAGELAQETNFFRLAQILRQSFNWSRSENDGMYRSRTDYREEAIRNYKLSKTNTANDSSLVNIIKAKFEKEGLEFSEFQLSQLYGKLDSSRSYVDTWVRDYGILTTADTLLDGIKETARINKAADKVGLDYVKQQRLSESGSSSTETNKWSDLDEDTQDRDGLIKASPGATRLRSLAKAFKGELGEILTKETISAEDLATMFKKIKIVYEDSFEDTSNSQATQRDEYIEKIINVAWTAVEQYQNSNNKSLFLIDKNSDKYKQLVTELIQELKVEWLASTRDSIIGDDSKLLNNFFSEYRGSANVSALSAYFYNNEGSIGLSKLFKGRDINGINERIGYYHFLTDYLAKVFDFGRDNVSLIASLKSEKADNIGTVIDDAPVLAPYIFIIQKIKSKLFELTSEKIQQLSVSETITSQFKEGFLDQYLLSGFSIGNDSDESDIPTLIELNFPTGGKTILTSLEDLSVDNEKVIAWVRSWNDRASGSTANRQEAFAEALTKAGEDAAFNTAKTVKELDQAYDVVEEYFSKNPTYIDPVEATELLEVVAEKEIYQAQNAQQPTEDDMKYVRSYLYIDKHVDFSKALQVTSDTTVPTILLNGEYLLSDYNDLIENLDEVQAQMTKIIVKQLYALGITIVTQDDSIQISKKEENRTILVTENRYLDLTYVAFINKFRENALAQNDTINDIVNEVAEEELTNYRNNILGENEKTNLLYFKKSDLSKVAIEYIWIDLAKRDAVEFKKQLKAYIISATGRNIISDRITDLTVWEKVQDDWTANVIEDIKKERISTDYTFFSAENKTNYALNVLKPLLANYMEEVYKTIKTDIEDFSDFNYEGVKSFNSIVENLGKLNNEFNNLLPRKLFALLGLELTQASINKLMRPLSLFIDKSKDFSNVKLMSSEIGRDLSLIPSMKNYTKAIDGTVVISEAEESNYASNLDRIFTEYVNEQFIDYIQNRVLFKYSKIDRNAIYEEIETRFKESYASEYLEQLTLNNKASVLSGEVFERVLKNAVSIRELEGIFDKHVDEIDLDIVEATDPTIWQNYIIEEIVEKDVKEQYSAPTKDDAFWEFIDNGLPLMNILINTGLDNAITAFNDKQTVDADGYKFTIDKKRITTTKGQEIITDLLTKSLNSFTDLMKKATAEQDPTILPDATQYAYTVVKGLYDDINDPEAWNEPFENFKSREIAEERILKLNDFRDLDDLNPDQKTQLEYKSLILLQKTLFSNPNALSKEDLLEIYTAYADYAKASGATSS